ncbi:MAG: GntR family transcriptional regulator [Pelolinea sp.]|nr:GntR family transcriptional regulator [Pelolinea sp.]
MNETQFKPKKIDKDLPIPYYYQIVQTLRESINDLGEPDGNKKIALPSEPELCDLFSVNRGTIRHALQVLEREGLIYREKGKGTFIRRRRVEMDLSYLCSTTEDMKNRGWEPSTEIINIEKIIPSFHVQTSLKLPDGAEVWSVLRCRSANDEPISLQRAYVPLVLMPDLDKRELSGSFYEIWKKQYQIYPNEGEQTIRTRTATEEEATLLAIDGNSPIFEITRITVDINGTPIEYLVSLWRGDRYDFFVRLSVR